MFTLVGLSAVAVIIVLVNIIVVSNSAVLRCTNKG